MSKKTDIRVCRYYDCPYDHKIDISKDKYTVQKKTMYYHTECLKRKQKGSEKDDKVKADIQYIKNGWVKHISKTVVFSQLHLCLNELLSRGIESDYLVFVFDYVVKNKLNLKHPLGFKYFVDKECIKNAYKAEQYRKRKIQKPNEFKITEDNSNSPKFKLNQKSVGFSSILGGGKK
ncbi:MAG TPA: hypothetical protein OIL97_04045 [Oscillospiraceae bacterium]|nr:hypothetical protein [Oscillospiraceae bacterium]